VRKVLLVIFLIGIWQSRAYACSLSRDYVPPTNFELVQLAEAIVIARLETLENGETGFELVEVLKGPKRPDTLYRIAPRLSTEYPSHPYSLQTENASDGGGSCRRGAYAEGKLHLLFYSKNPNAGAFFQSVAIFGRDSEDIESMDAFWLRVVRKYLDIQARHTPMQQIDALRRLRRDLLDERISPQQVSWIMDIENHLVSATPYKPMEFLLEMYKTLKEKGKFPDAAPYYDLGLQRGFAAISDKEQVAKSMMLNKENVAPARLLRMIRNEADVAILGRLLAVFARSAPEADVLKTFDMITAKMVLGPDEELDSLASGLAAAINNKLDMGAGLSPAWRQRILILFTQLYHDGFWLTIPRAAAQVMADDWDPNTTPSEPLAYLLAIHDYAPLVAWAERILSDNQASISDLTTALRVKLMNRSKGPKNLWRTFLCGEQNQRTAFLGALDAVHVGSGKRNWYERIAASAELSSEDWAVFESMLRRRAERDMKATARNGRGSYSLGRAVDILKKRAAGKRIEPSYGATALTCAPRKAEVSAAF